MSSTRDITGARGLTPQRAELLKWLAMNPFGTLQEFGDAVGIGRAAVCYRLTGLLRLGFAVTTKSKSRTTRLTPQGWAEAAKLGLHLRCPHCQQVVQGSSP